MCDAGALEAAFDGVMVQLNAAAPDSIRDGDSAISTDVNNDSTVTGSLSVETNPPSRYLTGDDSVTIHNGNVVSVNPDEWTTILDISAATDHLGGVAYDRHIVPQLTLDGTVVIGSTNDAAGRDGSGDVYSTPILPPARAEESLKVGLQAKGGGKQPGWVDVLDDMSYYIFIPSGDGYRSHTNVEDPSVYNLPETAAIYDSTEAFKDRLADFSDT